MSIATVHNAILNQFQRDTAIRAHFYSALTGTASSSTVNVTGVSTLFTTQLKVGDYIGNITKGYRKVKTITNATALVVKSAFDAPLAAEAIEIIHIRKGMPDELNLSEVGKTLRVVFNSSASSDKEVPNTKAAVHYGFIIVVGFKEEDEDEAEDRKSIYEKILNDNVDTNPNFGGVVIGTTDLGQMKFASNPYVEGMYLGAVPLVVTRHETRGNR